jgi:hypothetical protein
MNWKKIEIEPKEENEAIVVRFEEKGDEFIGKYMGYVEYKDKTTGEDKIFYKFVDLDDEEINYIMFPSSVILNKMKMVPLDAPVKIVYEGLKKSEKSKFKYKDFSFYLSE